MARIEASLFEIGTLDTFSYQKTPVHRLDPRIKVVTTLLFIVVVLSFDKHTVSALVPFVIYPIALATLGNVPFGYLFKKILVALPFALMIGILNPVFDRSVMLYIGSIQISGGWVSFTSIMIRFALTVSAALILVATTGFNSMCTAMERMGAPRVFASQLSFLFRYLFVLTEEAVRMVRARALRSFNGRGMGFKVFVNMMGQLLLRTMDRAERIHLAMLCRGFDGRIRTVHPMKISSRDIAFMAGWSIVFVAMRIYDVPQGLGAVALGLF